MPDRVEKRPSVRFRGALAALALLLSLFSGCAATPPAPPAPPAAAPKSRDTIILLPDASGRTGAIIVSGGGKEVRLSEKGQAVMVEEGSAPGIPFVMSDNEVAAIAGPALKALPSPPKQYILYFEHNSAILTKESRALLAAVMKTIREQPPIDISVVGHTDTVGDRLYNFRLSYRRAKAVADLLAAQGADRSIMEITSHGKENPLIKTGDQVHEPRNRRVEVTVR